MTCKHIIQRYRHWYAQLVRLYPKSYCERFGESMEQTFNDLLQNYAKEERDLFSYVLWMFIETFMNIISENMKGIKMQSKSILIQNKRIIILLLTIGGILSLPALAMLYTNEVIWTAFDFIVAGALLLGTGLGVELAIRKSVNNAYKAAACLAVITTLLLTWLNLAVGIIGSENNPLNQMYFIVPVVGIIGAISARFRPLGMARALFATALVQLLVPVIALMIGRPPIETLEALTDVVGVFILSSFFALLFAGSALLFWRGSE